MASQLKRLIAIFLVAVIPFAQGIKLKFRYEECLSYDFAQYETFYGSYVAMPDLYNMQAKYDLVITAPSGSRVFEALAQPDAKFHIVPYESGRYRFCLRLNQERSISKYVLSREVNWDLHIGHTDSPDHVKEQDTQQIWHNVYQVDAQLQQLKATQQYLFWREKRHRITVESTNKRVVLYAIMRAVALVVVSIAQVLVIRRMFTK